MREVPYQTGVFVADETDVSQPVPENTPMTEPAPAPWALLLAAGDGTRLSEVTRGNDGVPVPKQFCSFGGDASLLGLARDRARRVVADARIVTVVAERHERWWRRELTGGRNVVVQPENRGTAVGLLLPLLAIAERDPDARVWVLPSDHWVRDEDTPARCAREALARVHAEPDRIVLMGIEPDDADSQYGWVLPVEARDDRDFRPVASFVEKPPVHEARRLRERGAVWNSFLIVARARALVRLYERRLPGLLATMRRALAARELAPAYASLPVLDFSKDVLQGSEDDLLLQRVPACGWSDLGTPDRLRSCLADIRTVGTGRTWSFAEGAQAAA